MCLQSAHLAIAGWRRGRHAGRDRLRDDGTELPALFADIAHIVGQDHLVIVGTQRHLAEDRIECSSAQRLGDVDRLHALGLLDRLEDHLHAEIGFTLEAGRLIAVVFLLPCLDEGLVFWRIQRRGIVDDAPDALRSGYSGFPSGVRQGQ